MDMVLRQMGMFMRSVDLSVTEDLRKNVYSCYVKERAS